MVGGLVARALVVVLAIGIGVTDAQAEGLRYKILNQHSGKALATSGDLVVQWTDNGSESQQWVLVEDVLVNLGSGKALDVPNYSMTPGTQLVQWTPNGGANQRWKIVGDTLVSASSGMLADVEKASTADGAAVVQWPVNGGANQRWTLVSLSGSRTP